VVGILLAVVFIALNGFFVAAEFAIVKISTTLAYTKKAPREDPRIRRARAVVGRLDRYLSVTQFGVTLASLGLGWIGQPAIEQLVDNAVRSLLGREPGEVVHVAIVVLSFTVLTFSHVLLGELVPKLVAIQRSEKIAYGAAPSLQLVYVIFRPLLWILERATRLILRTMGLNADAANEGTLSEEELIGILAANAARGHNGKSRAELFEHVSRFAQRTARHAMVPRVDVFSLPVATTGVDAIAQLRMHQYSRVILTRDRSLDEIAGYLYVKDFLLDPESAALPSLENLRREILFVPEAQSLSDVLREMQRSQVQIAVVVDEYGGTSGILTMEDLLEEIVGEIRDELDVEAAHLVEVPGEYNTWDVDARASMEELRPAGVQAAPEEWAETVGTVVLNRLGRIPRVGDRVDLDPYATAEITSVSRRRIMGVRVHIEPSSKT